MESCFSYHSNPHIAFPLGFGDMKSQSARAERFLPEKQAWLCVRVEAVAYDAFTRKEAGRGNLDRLFPGMTESMGRLPDPDALWLYHVVVFTARSLGTESRLILPADECGVAAAWFDDFHAMLAYCEKEHGIAASGFESRFAGKSLGGIEAP
ncbi:MAG: hypothetical protein NC211_06925 [Alistipes senegalensis]|nr:hypothetical protein [Oxalobacter formigenes]MCM1281543.1 hypothetical protein [Alistipes senegalensis]